MSPVITHGSVSLRYEERGSGKPLLFIHGWGMSAWVWTEVMENLSGASRVIAIDLRGHGLSSPAESYSLSALVDDLLLLIRALDLSEVILAGWSMGGQIALATAPALRERLAGLILIGTTPKFTSDAGYRHGLPASDARGMEIRLKRAPLRAMRDFCRSMFTDHELSCMENNYVTDFFDNVGTIPDEAVLLPVLDTLIKTDLRSSLKEIDLPVLLIHGSRDRICLPGASRFMAEQLPKGTLHILEDAGHAPFLTCQEKFISMIGRFMKRVHEQG